MNPATPVATSCDTECILVPTAAGDVHVTREFVAFLLAGKTAEARVRVFAHLVAAIQAEAR